MAPSGSTFRSLRRRFLRNPCADAESVAPRSSGRRPTREMQIGSVRQSGVGVIIAVLALVTATSLAASRKAEAAQRELDERDEVRSQVP